MRFFFFPLLSSVAVSVNAASSFLNKALCRLLGHGGEGRGEEGGGGGAVPSPAPRHHVLGLQAERLQGSAEAEEGLGDPAHQRGGELSRTLPPDARQRE